MFDTGTQLRKARRQSNLTLDQLASLSGVDRGTISRIELGHVSPRIDTISSLCTAMKVPISRFFGEGTGPEPALPAPPAPGSPVEPEAYWPLPASVWQGMVGVVERFEALLAGSAEMALALNPLGRVVYLSPGGERLLGYRRQDLLGSPVLDLVHGEDQDRFLAAFARLAAAPASAYRMRHRDGKWQTFACAFSDHRGNPAIHAVILNASLASE